ncbi:MAG TPA: NAD-dependent epimerase/dehydratase family protein [Candidatus Binatia bacterium]|jgi:nucleoside-diphosphate-sugar epimerase|nr:NAD-dependent epimerase/dehydratase family protein [Candidatus Binatia bacterium]
MHHQRILIAGGAGFLGAKLADSFRRDRIQVRLLDLVECPDWACRPGFEYLRGDIRDPTAVTAALKDVDAVVHAAFASPHQPAEVIRRVNVEGTRNLCAAAVSAGVRRFILISSTIVSKARRVHPLFRKSPLTRLDLYRAARAEAEKLVAEYGSRGLSSAIVRPKTFVGPGCLSAFAILFEWIWRGRSVPILGTGRNRYQLLDVRDMVAGICLLMTADAEGVFSFGAREYRTVTEDLQTLLDHARTGARLQFIPGRIARVGLRAMELANLAPLSEWHYMSARGEDSVVDISRAERELGWRPESSNARALREAYDWYVASMTTTGRARTRHPVPFAHQLLKRLSSIFP